MKNYKYYINQLDMNEKQNTEQVGFAIQPKMNCPHLTQALALAFNAYLLTLTCHVKQLSCKECDDKQQNWVCLGCQDVFCSRYVKGHMAQHNQQTRHPIALSFSDGSYWCYSCDNYIQSSLLRPARKTLSDLITKAEQQRKKKKQVEKDQKSESKEQKQQQQVNEKQEDKQDVSMLEKMFKFLGVSKNKEQPKKITLDEIVNKMKAKQYKRVVVLTGAGLSVAAGIPDFRSPGTGLYSKLQSYNLPYPQAIFQLKYFKHSPTAFISLCKELLTAECKPTLGHYFIKRLSDEGILHVNLTQNIDDLEIKAGLPENKLIQAHGHSRSAHCIQCHSQGDIKKWKQFAAQQKPMKCSNCQGLIKPDIIFFGEQLPKQFYNAPKLVGEADLAIIIGTSLKVMPFAYLAQIINPQAPVILINREDVLEDRDYKVWLGGDIQENVKDIMDRLGWK